MTERPQGLRREGLVKGLGVEDLAVVQSTQVLRDFTQRGSSLSEAIRKTSYLLILINGAYFA
jgi:hypothetical protein